MFQEFGVRHIPPLLVASAVTFGGLIPFFDAEYALLTYGLPPRVATSEAAQSVMIASSARGTAIGLSMFAFYARRHYEELDLVMTILGAYVGLTDGYVCLRERVPKRAMLRVTSGLLVAAWGFWGMTGPQS